MSNLLDPAIYQKVRLKPEDLNAIVSCFQENYTSNDHLWIFGSRVDMNARGGDIDLYIETLEEDEDKIYDQKNKFIIGIWKRIGEQRIDVVVKNATSTLQLPIYNIAIKHGVKLI